MWIDKILGNAHVQRWARILLVLASVYAFLMAVMPYTGNSFNQSDKILHMLAFGALALLAAIGLPRTGMWVIFAVLSTVGGAIEWIQSWEMIGRDAQWSDLFADMVAALGAVMFVRVWLGHGRI